MGLKYSVTRVLGLTFLTFGLYILYWFYQSRKQLNVVLSVNSNPTLSTALLLIPVVGYWSLYAFLRDLNCARTSVGLAEFSPGGYVSIPAIAQTISLVAWAGAISTLLFALREENTYAGSFIARGLEIWVLPPLILVTLIAVLSGWLFFGLGVRKTNQYWDTLHEARATEAHYAAPEIIVIIIGIALSCVAYYFLLTWLV